jgi:signal transduction histidine kinase
MSQIHTKTSVRLGLKGRLLLVVLPLVLAALGAVWFLATTTAREGLQTLTNTNLSLASENLSNAVAGVMVDARADAITTARLDLPAQAIDSEDPKNVTWYADEMVRTKGKYAGIVVANENGVIVAANTVGRDGKKLKFSLIGRSLKGLKWAQAALQSKPGEGVTVPPSSPDFLKGIILDGEKVAGFSLPVLDIMDERIGTVTVLVSLNFVAELISGFLRVKDGQMESVAFLSDAQGQALAIPAAIAGRSKWAGAKLPTSGGEGAVWEGPAGNTYVYSHQKVQGALGNMDWRLVAMTTVAALEAPVRAMSDELLYAFLVALLLTAVALIIFAGRFVGPIQRLTLATVATEKATDFTAIPIETNDEVGVLTASFNRMLSTLSEYQLHLEEKVMERTRDLAEAKQEVSDILDNMAQAIFTINEAGKVNREFSAYTRELFGDVEIAGTSALDLLQLNPSQNKEDYSRMSFWLGNITGADELQWMMSEDEGISDAQIMRGGPDGQESQRFLELKYAPIYKAGVVDKIMVIAKDVTTIKGLEDEVDEKEREKEESLDRVSEIASMDPELFETFINESYNILLNCDEVAAALGVDLEDKDAINSLFRHMHTLKGNARIFQVTTVQNVAHNIEEYFGAIRDGREELTAKTVERVTSQLKEVRELLGQFEQLGRRVLSSVDASARGRGQATTRIPETRILSLRKEFKELARALSAVSDKLPVAVVEGMDELSAAVKQLTMVPMTHLFERFRKMIFDLGKELGKSVNDLEVEGDEILVDAKLIDKMRDVLIHALRNCMDHGIESPDERGKAGKEEKGHIRVLCAQSEGALVFEITDDGNGVDIEGVKQFAFQKKFLSEEALENITDQELCNLLFEPGFTTAKKVTDVSGRGVGMDVIRTTMRELKGDAEMTSESGSGSKLKLWIPADYYQRL